MRNALLTALLSLLAFSSACLADESAWVRFMTAGEAASAQEKYADAENALSLALGEAEKFGPLDDRLATTLNNLGQVYDQEGKYEQAEPLYKRCLRISEKIKGPNHPDVAISLKNLGQLYWEQGKYEESEALINRAMQIDEKALGPNDRQVANLANSLATLYASQGRYAESERLYKRALQIWGQSNNPDLASVVNNLAQLYYKQGKYDQAEPLYKRALQIFEKTSGFNSSGVATALHNLAQLYRKQGKSDWAESMYKRSLQIEERTFGPEHPDVAPTLDSLAELYREQGKFAEAEPLYKRALQIREKHLGPNHPDLATSLNNLALLYVALGKNAQAEPLYERALAIDKKARGANSPETAKTLNNLGELYKKRGRYAEAEPLYKQALSIAENSLGRDHLDTAEYAANYAELLRKMNRPGEAQQLESHYQIASSSGNYAENSAQSGTPAKERAPEPAATEQSEPDYGDYMEAVQRRIKDAWQPPPLGQSLTTVVHFAIARDGKVAGASVSKSSGNAEADRSALNALKTVSLDPLPAGSPSSVDVDFTFDFKGRSDSQASLTRALIPPDVLRWLVRALDWLKLAVAVPTALIGVRSAVAVNETRQPRAIRAAKDAPGGELIPTSQETGYTPRDVLNMTLLSVGFVAFFFMLDIWPRYALAYLVALFGLLCLLHLVRALAGAVAGIMSLGWPKSEGVIKEFARVLRSTGGRRQTFRWTECRIRYEYKVRGKQYSSNKVIAAKPLEKDYLRWLHDYRNEQRLPVYYNPGKPEQAVLEPGLSRFTVLQIVLWGTLTLLLLTGVQMVLMPPPTVVNFLPRL